MLWPDAAGDAAQCSFDITLHRLRKLLHRDDAVMLSDRKVSLNARVVWTDTWEFTSLVNEAFDLLAPSHSGVAPIGPMESLSRQILSLYRADFLQTEEALPWVLAARDRYRSQWLRFIAAAGQVLLNAQRLELAIGLYQQALESDPLAEELYQQLMRCYQRAGRHAEAIGVYRRCRDMLSILLGMQPSERTTLIYRECQSA
jgi:LuxR family maltose regulon positive regulatory protein